MTGLHENSMDQLAEAGVHWVCCKSLAKPATLVLEPSEQDFMDKESHSQSKKRDRRCQCRFLSCPNHRHR